MIIYNNYKLPLNLEYVGDGFTIRKTGHCSNKETLDFMQALCQHLIAHPDPFIVPVVDFQYLGQKSDYYHIYSYDMIRMGDITKEEKTIIWEVVRAKGAWANSEYCSAPTTDPLHIFRDDAVISSEQAWQDYPELMNYLGEVIEQGRYHDLHDENIMVDGNRDYKIIDLEGFINPPLSDPSNDWIT